MVVRYDYLWRGEQQLGREEGMKDRPCAIVIAHAADDNGARRVVLAAITHSAPASTDGAIEIPAKVKQRLGLDDARSWIVTREVNSVDWDDAGLVPITKGKWTYGFLPAKLAQAVTTTVLRHARGRQLHLVRREP